MSRPRGRVLAGTVSAAVSMFMLALLGVATLAEAHVGDGLGAAVIHACVASNGRVSIVGEDGSCKTNRIPDHWSIQGPAGVLGSFDDLEGLACTRDGQAGTVDVSYTAAGAVIRCVTVDRFIDNGDGTVTDTQTGLQWEQKTDDGSVHDKDNSYSWSLTLAPPDGTAFTDFLERVNGRLCSVADANAGTCQGLGGHSDWRLPTIAELQTILLAPWPCGTSPCIDPIFGPTAAFHYWSSTTHAADANSAWFVFFGNGDVGNNVKNDILFVRAVRGGP